MTFWVAGAVVGSALISSSSANKAAGAQSQAAAQSADMSKAISDQRPHQP